MTFFAPALAANMERMPVPHPTSRTTLSLRAGGKTPFSSWLPLFGHERQADEAHLKRCLFHHMLLR